MGSPHAKEQLEALADSPAASDSGEQNLELEHQHQPAESENELTRAVSLHDDVSLPREVLVVGLITLSQWTTQMGLSQCMSIIHIIGDHFGVTDPGTLGWLIAGYSLTVGTFILLSGRLGDVFGWKRMLIWGYVWFGIWSIVAGLSWYSDHVLFVFARIFQGIGPAVTLPNGLALLGGLYKPGNRKNMAFAVFGATAPAGSIVGAAFGGVWALTWWPWTFLSFGIALFIIAIIAVWAIPDPQTTKPGIKGKTFKEILDTLDILGATVGITALILFNFAWNQAPIVGWDNPYIIVTLILGTLLFPTFLWIELKVAAEPLIPIDVFTSANAFVLACVSCGWANFGIWFFYTWQILLVLRDTSPLLASAYLSPLVVSGAIAAITTGIVLGKLRPAWVMVIAMCAFLTGTILIATLPVFQIYWAQLFVCMCIAAFGMDMSFPSATLVISDAVKKEHQGVAASLVNTIVNYSISLGLGFASTIDVHVNNGGKNFADVLHGYRSALWFGVGLAGLGLCTSIAFVLKSYHDDRKESSKANKEEVVDEKA